MIKITDELKARVTSAEGIVDHVYLDSLGKATIGIGHLIKPHEKERFPEGKKISREEIDSRWHKQTTNRCEHLAEIVANT